MYIIVKGDKGSAILLMGEMAAFTGHTFFIAGEFPSRNWTRACPVQPIASRGNSLFKILTESLFFQGESKIRILHFFL